MLVLSLLLVFMGAVANALPTASNADGRGATIWTAQDFDGASTFIPGNAWCTDLNNIFGSFDGKVRSLSVGKGYTCRFYTSYGCPTSGKKLELGSSSQGCEQPKLPADFDFKIHSVICVPHTRSY